MTLKMLEYKNVIFKSRDMHSSVPQFDFIFKVVIPKANKERLIIERDSMVRIVISKVLNIDYLGLMNYIILIYGSNI